MGEKINSKHFSARDYFTLEFIPFVTSTNNDTIVNPNCKKSLPTSNCLKGNEAKDFYEHIISTPSTSKPQTSCKKVEKEKTQSFTKSGHSQYNAKHFLKYAQEGDIEAVKMCLCLKHSQTDLLNQQDMYGWTALMCATCEGHTDIVNVLLKHGADKHLKNKQNMTALDIAMQKRHFQIADRLQNGISLHSKEKLPDIPKDLYCNECKQTYKEGWNIHERSIAHLFNTTKADHTTFYHIPENNKGFQMMVKSGWDQNKGLGSKEEGRKFPIKTILKKDRSCIGRKKEVARVTHFNANDRAAVKRICDPAVKVVREKTLKKWQRHKLERKNRQKEIDFRRQFLCDY